MNCNQVLHKAACTFTIAIGLLPASAASVVEQLHDNPIMYRGEIAPRTMDTGIRPNNQDVLRVVFADVVHTEGAAWQRLYFSQIDLEGDSRIRFTSLHDGDVQEFDAHDAAVWSYNSAYFNGDSVLVELIGAPGTRNNRAILEEVGFEMQMGGGTTLSFCGICGGNDSRVPSDEDWAGRIIGGGSLCSGAVYNQDSCIVTAGHCNVGTNSIIQFKVPNSTPGCNIQHPSAVHQYPITQVVTQFTGSVGTDWAIATTGLSNGLHIYERYGEFRPLASSVPSSGTAQIWGFGQSKTCTLTNTQQFSQGNITGLSSSTISYQVDIAGGSSGSGILHNDEIIAIATTCVEPCPPFSNLGPRVDQVAFQNAVEDLCPAVSPPPNNCCTGAFTVVEGNTALSNIAATTCGQSEPNLCTFFGDSNVQSDVWFNHTAECDGQLIVSACDVDFTSKIAVYAGACPTQPNQAIACDLLSCPEGSGAVVTVPDVQAGQIYRIRVGGHLGSEGEGVLNILCDDTPPSPECPADLSGPAGEPDETVDVFDLIELINQWGPCDDPSDCPADLSGPAGEPDGTVDVFDLIELINQWGPCD